MTTSEKDEQLFPPGDLSRKMLNLFSSIEKLQEKLEPIISKPHHEVFSKLSPLNKSKMGLLESYTINSLFWILMKMSNEDDSSLRDDYKIEMSRLKELQSRITEIEMRAQRPNVDITTASRFIKRGLGKRTDIEEDEESPTKKIKIDDKPSDCENESYKKAWQ